MRTHLSEAETLARLRLSRRTLTVLAEAEVVIPTVDGDERVYARVDVARLEMLSDVAAGYDLDDESLCLVLRLVDRLHETRAGLHAVARALEREPEAVRSRILGRLRIIGD